MSSRTTSTFEMPDSSTAGLLKVSAESHDDHYLRAGGYDTHSIYRSAREYPNVEPFAGKSSMM